MMSRWFTHWFKLLLATLVALAVLLSAPLHTARQGAVNGTMLGKRMLPSALGRSVSDGVLLVGFWAPGCIACQAQIQELNRLQAAYRARGLTVIGLARAPPRELTAQGDGRSVPYAVLVDRNGIVVWQGEPADLHSAIIETTLDAPRLGALAQF